jgi:2-dehydro-3-deoxygluconokinase
MPVFVGGAELNVANALANWNIPVRYSTIMPENQLSVEIKEYIQQKGIDTAGIRHFGSRIGSYYLAARCRPQKRRRDLRPRFFVFFGT